MPSYNGFVERLSKKVRARLADIEAVYSFDLGVEFEVAMCHLLSDMLPAKFGVCRGFVVSEEGHTAGDDVIVFDRMSCPTLRSSVGQQVSVKEQIPIEAVYAYIECKNSINDDATLNKAVDQVRIVKSLLMSRYPKENPDYECDGPVYAGKRREWPRCYPKLRNQPFCAIVARRSSGVSPQNLVRDNLTPDLMILGEDYLASQSVVLGPDGIKAALFFDDKFGAPLRLERAKEAAFGIGIISLMQALSWIELRGIDWAGTLNEAYWDSLRG
jgi:hypothetical protein